MVSFTFFAISTPKIGEYLISKLGIVGCTPTNVPLYGKSLYKPSIVSIYRLESPKNPLHKKNQWVHWGPGFQPNSSLKTGWNFETSTLKPPVPTSPQRFHWKQLRKPRSWKELHVDIPTLSDMTRSSVEKVMNLGFFKQWIWVGQKKFVGLDPGNLI